MEKKEEEKIIKENPHLQKYLENLHGKITRPAFYSKLPRDLKEEKYPNVIYPTKGSVFIHIFRTKDMEGKEYHAIEPTLTEAEKTKRDHILDLIYERVPYRNAVKTDDQIKEAIGVLLEEITLVDERAAPLEKVKRGKIRVTPVEKRNIEYDITKNIIGGGATRAFYARSLP